MHHVRAAYCGGERYKILLPRGTAQPTSSQAEAHTDLMPTQQAYSEVKFLLTSLKAFHALLTFIGTSLNSIVAFLKASLDPLASLEASLAHFL